MIFFWLLKSQNEALGQVHKKAIRKSDQVHFVSSFVRDDMGEARKIYDLDQCGCIRLWNAVCLNWLLNFAGGQHLGLERRQLT